MSQKVLEHFSKLHSGYENKALRILLKEFRLLLNSINYNNITPENAEALVLININEESLTKSMLKLYLSIGNSYGEIISRQLQSEQKRKPFPLFSEAYQRLVVSYLRNEGFNMIQNMTKTMASEVSRAVINIAKIETDIFKMRKEIQRVVKKPDFYKWQALRIARTETTFAMNAAKNVSAEVSGLVLEKEWIGRNDGRERPSHISQNGKRVPQNGFFNVGGYKMLYPGDKNAGAEEVVNCRCTFALRPKRDSNGRLVYQNQENTEPFSNQNDIVPQTPKNDKIPDFIVKDTDGAFDLSKEVENLDLQYKNLRKERNLLAEKLNTLHYRIQRDNLNLSSDEFRNLLQNNKEYSSLLKSYKDANNKVNEIQPLLLQKNKDLENLNQKHFKELLDRIDGSSGTMITTRGSDYKDTINDFKKLSKGYNENVEIKIKKTRSNRAYYIDVESTVYINSHSSKFTLMHELGHSLEKDERVFKSAVDFLLERTKNNPLRSLRELNRAYALSEVYKEGGFFSPYVGKFYRARSASSKQYNGLIATEIVSMGIEQMYRNPVLFYKKDKGHFEFIYNLFFKPR